MGFVMFRSCYLKPSREPWYSRGIRQRLYNISQAEDWRGRHAIHIDGYGEDQHIAYTKLLASSVFCLAVPGAWTDVHLSLR